MHRYIASSNLRLELVRVSIAILGTGYGPVSQLGGVF